MCASWHTSIFSLYELCKIAQPPQQQLSSCFDSLCIVQLVTCDGVTSAMPDCFHSEIFVRSGQYTGHRFLPCNVASLSVIRPSVCLSVCHTHELRLNSSRYRNMLCAIRQRCICFPEVTFSPPQIQGFAPNECIKERDPSCQRWKFDQ